MANITVEDLMDVLLLILKRDRGSLAILTGVGVAELGGIQPVRSL
jgi:hypothetical protein